MVWYGTFHLILVQCFNLRSFPTMNEFSGVVTSESLVRLRAGGYIFWGSFLLHI